MLQNNLVEQKVALPVSPYDDYCDGFGNPGATGNGYILGMVLEVAVVPLQFSHTGSTLLDEINAFDQAEVTGPYLGQINMITVSSFCGPQGMILGYDLHNSPPQKISHPLMPEFTTDDNRQIPVFSIDPLITATKNLFGTVDNLRYPLRPGSMVPCAAKKFIGKEDSHIYAGIGIGIPKNREQHACLLMEDLGSFVGHATLIEDQIIAYRRTVLKNLASSIVQIGKNQHVEYQEIILGVKSAPVGPEHVGCALVAAPYFTLAKNALRDFEKQQQ